MAALVSSDVSRPGSCSRGGDRVVSGLSATYAVSSSDTFGRGDAGVLAGLLVMCLVSL